MKRYIKVLMESRPYRGGYSSDDDAGKIGTTGPAAQERFGEPTAQQIAAERKRREDMGLCPDGSKPPCKKKTSKKKTSKKTGT